MHVGWGMERRLDLKDRRAVNERRTQNELYDRLDFKLRELERRRHERRQAAGLGLSAPMTAVEQRRD